MGSAERLAPQQWMRRLRPRWPQAAERLAPVSAHLQLASLAPALACAFEVIGGALERGGALYLAGNGGSLSDALHISGELLKSFAAPRPLPADLAARLRADPAAAGLAEHLQAGLRAHVLGINPALSSAVANDIALPGIGLAQELLALARPGDVLLGISTSGRARNVLLAVTLARALGLTTIGLTGQAPNPLAAAVEIALAVPERETYRVQELHIVLYHALCLMLEARFFPQNENGAALADDATLSQRDAG